MLEEGQLEVEAEVTEAVAPLTEESADTVAASEETHEEKSFYSAEQKKTAAAGYRMREATRTLQREKDELAAKLESLNVTAQANNEPVVPVLSEFPDADEVAEYTKQVTAAAQFQAQQAFNVQQQQNTAQQAQIAEQKQQTETEQAFRDSATKLGIKDEDLATAINIVGGYGLNMQAIQGMLKDKDGPLALLHISTNPHLVDDLNNADAFSLGTVYTGIKEASAALRPKTSSAPSPAESLNGNGAPPTVHPALEGVIYT